MTAIRHITVLAALLTGILLAGCGGDDDSTKAGGTGAPVTLRIGTDDAPGKPASDQIEEFARRVEQLSDGRLRIKPIWHAAGDGPDWDQRVARMVTSGKLDMTLTPSRAWDTEGVTTLRALNAPFLIDSDELLNDVVSSDGLTDDLMSGLDKAGVVGLALFPDGLRHPFGLKKPLLGPEDYAGQAIRTPTSKTTAAVFEALGATVNDKETDEKIHAGLESAYNQEPPGTATGNVTFYPKVNSLVVNQETFDGLDDDQRGLLEKAAIQTRDWAIDENQADLELAQAFCKQGARLVMASKQDLAALERAEQPVTAELERDDPTKQIMEAIRDLKQEVAVSATAAPGCGQDGDSAASTSENDISQLDGIYRYETTDDDLREAGVTDPGAILENHGVTTDTLEGGTSCWKQRAPNPTANGEDCNPYEIDGDRLIFKYPAGEPDVYRFEKLPNRDLKLTFVSAEPGQEEIAAAFAVRPWQRIGDVE